MESWQGIRAVFSYGAVFWDIIKEDIKIEALEDDIGAEEEEEEEEEEDELEDILFFFTSLEH